MKKLITKLLSAPSTANKYTVQTIPNLSQYKEVILYARCGDQLYSLTFHHVEDERYTHTVVLYVSSSYNGIGYFVVDYFTNTLKVVWKK